MENNCRVVDPGDPIVYSNSSTYSYDTLGRLTGVHIDDGQPRDVVLINDAEGKVLQRYQRMNGWTQGGTEAAELHYRYGGIAVGDIGNNGTSDVDYAASIAQHRHPPPTTHGPFADGSNTATLTYDFDQSYDAVNGLTYESTFSRYTVVEGDTLESIAQQVWGDSSYWYLIADANGLDGSDPLIAGTDLIIPAKVHNSHNTSDVYRVYDPNEAIGDTSPARPKPQKLNDDSSNCGVAGQILLVIVAVAVAYFTFGAGLSVLGASSAAELSIGEAAALGAVSGAAGSVASQGVGVLTGIQSKFDWGAVGIAAIAGAVGGALGPNTTTGLNGAFSGVSDSSFVQGFLRGATSNALTQGISVAVGLQKRFDWTSVASAGVVSGVSNWVGGSIMDANPNASHFATNLVSGMAGAIAGAATKTLLNGRDFGDNLMSLLPDAIGATIGNAIGEAVSGSSANFPKDGLKKPDSGQTESNRTNASSGGFTDDYDEFNKWDTMALRGARFITGGPAVSYVQMPQTINVEGMLGAKVDTSAFDNLQGNVVIANPEGAPPGAEEVITVTGRLPDDNPFAGLRGAQYADNAKIAEFRQESFTRETELPHIEPTPQSSVPSMRTPSFGDRYMADLRYHLNLAVRQSRLASGDLSLPPAGIGPGFDEDIAFVERVGFMADSAIHTAGAPVWAYLDASVGHGLNVATDGRLSEHSASENFIMVGSVAVPAAASARVAGLTTVAIPEEIAISPEITVPTESISIGNSGYRSVQEFTDAVTAKYQELYDRGYLVAMQRVKQGLINGTPTVIGRETDTYARTGIRDWLVSVEGIEEGPGQIIQVNRRLYDPSGSGDYRIPDIYIPGSKTILDGSLQFKTSSTAQMIDLRSFSDGANIVVVRPTTGSSSWGSYGIVH